MREPTYKKKKILEGKKKEGLTGGLMRATVERRGASSEHAGTFEGVLA